MSGKYKVENMIGNRYGRLTVIGPEVLIRDKNGHIEHFVYCRCDCGNSFRANVIRLANGEIKSCGCLNKDNLSKLAEGRHNGTIKSSGHTTHGDSAKDSPYRLLHAKWKRMRHKAIIGKYKMCPEWNNWIEFKQWSLDNGWTPENNATLVLTEGYYSPDTCEFVVY